MNCKSDTELCRCDEEECLWFGELTCVGTSMIRDGILIENPICLFIRR